jgi:probable F420-dependent oxidoreductase
MGLGVVLRDLLPSPGPAPSIPARRMAELAGEAEALGYDSVWITEGTGKESFAMLGAMATATRRVALGTSILPIHTRPATVTAMAAATLDDLADGRLRLGLGTGHPAISEMAHGVSLPHPLQAMREYVEALRLALSGEPMQYEGETLRIRRFQLEFTPPRRVPIFIAALGSAMLRLAGAIADGVIVTWVPAGRVPWVRAQVADGAQRAGRDPGEVAIVATVRVCAWDGPDVRDAARRQLAWYARLPVYARTWRASGFDAAVDRITAAQAAGVEAAARAVPDEMLDALVAFGAPARLRAHLTAYELAGVTLPLVYPVPAGADAPQTVLETMRAASPVRGEGRP